VGSPNIILCDDIVQVLLESEDNRWCKKIIELWLSHYPLATWPHRENGAIHLFGHIHSTPEGREGVDQDLLLHKNQCDVGVDYWGYKPVQFETLLEKMNIVNNK
jgi:calcineurin-like phosphoesterase family protein